MAKQIVTGENSRQAILRGVNILASQNQGGANHVAFAVKFSLVGGPVQKTFSGVLEPSLVSRSPVSVYQMSCEMDAE
jgi:hypothetical protein